MLRRIDKQFASVGLGLGSVERVRFSVKVRARISVILWIHITVMVWPRENRHNVLTCAAPGDS